MIDDDRICKKHKRGQHIALACKNHPHLRWSTKNISNIGARTIFYSLMPDDPKESECPCSAGELFHVCDESLPDVEQ